MTPTSSSNVVNKKEEDTTWDMPIKKKQIGCPFEIPNKIFSRSGRGPNDSVRDESDKKNSFDHFLNDRNTFLFSFRLYAGRGAGRGIISLCFV